MPEHFSLAAMVACSVQGTSDRVIPRHLVALNRPGLYCESSQWRALRAIYALNRIIFHHNLTAPDSISGSLWNRSMIELYDWIVKCHDGNSRVSNCTVIFTDYQKKSFGSSHVIPRPAQREK